MTENIFQIPLSLSLSLSLSPRLRVKDGLEQLSEHKLRNGFDQSDSTSDWTTHDQVMNPFFTQ